MDQLRPEQEMVARVRANYLKTFFDAGANCDGNPTMDKFRDLKQKREVFEELMSASHDLRVAIGKNATLTLSTRLQKPRTGPIADNVVK